MGLGEGTDAGIDEQVEQQHEDITGANWVPIEDLNTPADAQELLSRDARLYSEEGDEVGDPQQYVDEAMETVTDPELNSDLEPEQDNDPDDFEQPDSSGSSSQSNGDDYQLSAGDLQGLLGSGDEGGNEDNGQSNGTTPIVMPSSGGGSSDMMMLGAAAAVAAAAAFAMTR